MNNKILDLKNELTGALIGLAKSCLNNPKTDNTDRIIIEGLYSTAGDNLDLDNEVLFTLINKVKNEKNNIVPNCGMCASPCGNTSDYDMNKLWNDTDDIRAIKTLILFGIREISVYAYNAMTLGYENIEVNEFFYKSLSVIGYEMKMNDLLPIALEIGKINMKCMELLKKAYTTE